MSEHQAQDLLQQADKKLNSWSWFGSGNKQAEAAELYEKAANTFKHAQRLTEAGEAFLRAALLFKKSTDTPFEASKCFGNAAKCFRPTDAQAAIDVLQQAIAVDQDNCSFRNAAKHHQEIAQIYESDIIDVQGAMDHWEAAARFYSADDSQAMVNKCLLKVAHFASQLEQYDKAIEKLEEVAVASVNNPLIKWSLKEHFLKAGLCLLCIGDIPRIEQSLSKYCDMDISFETTREYAFLRTILDCVDQGDLALFTRAVAEYDQLNKLDSWKTSILLRIKKSITHGHSIL